MRENRFVEEQLSRGVAAVSGQTGSDLMNNN